MFATLFHTNQDDSDDFVENKEDSNILQIETIADGTCFLHAVLKCCSPEYQELSKEKDRREFAYKIRRELIPMLRTENPKFPSLESVVQFVKKSLMGITKGKSNETKGIQFKSFLETAFGFEYFSYPKQLKPFSPDYFDSLEEIYLYVANYRKYLIKFDDFLNKKESDIPDFKEILKKSGNRNEIKIEELNEEMKAFIKALKEVQNALSKKVNEQYYSLKKVLKTKLGLELYNPQNFGVGYVQAFLKDEPLPKGLYHELPWNCYFFTANSGVLTRFAYYPEKLIPGLQDLESILDNTRKFLGDVDIVPYIPAMLELNILVINFNENQFVNEYSSEETQNEPWIVISNNNNAHYYSCGYRDEEDEIMTLFKKEDPFIQRILMSKESQGKIDWNKKIKEIIPSPEEVQIVVEEEVKVSKTLELPKVSENLTSKTVSQLKEIASKQGIKIPSSAKKADILKLLE
jgi:hypothetical protein